MAESAAVPSSEDWKLAIIAFKLIEDLDSEDFRQELRQLTRALEGEGLAAHWSADRLEKRSVFTTAVSPSNHEAEAIDERTTVFTFGHAILLDAGDEERAWRGTPAQLAVVARATREDPADRYPPVQALANAWHAARDV